MSYPEAWSIGLKLKENILTNGTVNVKRWLGYSYVCCLSVYQALSCYYYFLTLLPFDLFFHRPALRLVTSARKERRRSLVQISGCLCEEGRCRRQLPSIIMAGSLIQVVSGPPPPLLLSVKFARCRRTPCPFPAGDIRNSEVSVDWFVNGRKRPKCRNQETENIRHIRPLNRKRDVCIRGQGSCLSI